MEEKSGRKEDCFFSCIKQAHGDKTFEFSEGKNVIVEHVQNLNLLLDRYMQKDVT